jgi:6-phosphofructokinase 1
MAEIKRVAVLTSGGDAPGMNATIRSIVRTGVQRGWQMYGVRHGYRGLLAGDLLELGARDVGGIMQEAGTILGSSRCEEFEQPGGPDAAVKQLDDHRIDALIVVGGNGSQSGSHTLAERGVNVIGVASTIDNDLVGSDITVGTDTALNIALEAIDRLRVTAYALRRISLVEVMGRDCGYLALMSGIAGGAEGVVIPEHKTDPTRLFGDLVDHHDRKSHAMVVVAEGADYNAQRLAASFREMDQAAGFKIRVTILGHVQRGGRPTAFDRLLGTRLGAGAIERLAAGESGALVGMLDDRVATTPLAQCVGRQKDLDPKLIELAQVLAR